MPSYDDEATELLYRHPTGTGFLPVIPAEPPASHRAHQPAWTAAAGWLTVLILILAAAGVARIDMLIWHWH